MNDKKRKTVDSLTESYKLTKRERTIEVLSVAAVVVIFLFLLVMYLFKKGEMSWRGEKKPSSLVQEQQQTK